MQKLTIGNGPDSVHITIQFEDSEITLEAGTVSVELWHSLVQRVNHALTAEGLMEKPKQTGNRSHGAPVKKAPWFLRPWYSKVQPKERSYIND